MTERFMRLQLLYVDDHLVVVNKPPGMLSQPDRTGDPAVADAAESLLDEKEPAGAEFLGLVHRLDRPASGVMVLARSREAARHLSAQFRGRLAEKRYLAIVEGRPEELVGSAVDYLVKEDRQVRVVPPSYAGAQRAALSWRVLASEDGLALLEVELETGRPHQIRVQLAHRGHPIMGDFRYGGQQELDGRNLALHAYQLAVEHPVRQRVMRWCAAPPVAWGGRFSEATQRLLAARRCDTAS